MVARWLEFVAYGEEDVVTVELDLGWRYVGRSRHALGVVEFLSGKGIEVAALALELIGRGIWKDAGVFSPEYFDPKPYLKLMEECGYEYVIAELK